MFQGNVTGMRDMPACASGDMPAPATGDVTELSCTMPAARRGPRFDGLDRSRFMNRGRLPLAMRRRRAGPHRHAQPFGDVENALRRHR